MVHPPTDEDTVQASLVRHEPGVFLHVEVWTTSKAFKTILPKDAAFAFVQLDIC